MTTQLVHVITNFSDIGGAETTLMAVVNDRTDCRHTIIAMMSCSVGNRARIHRSDVTYHSLQISGPASLVRGLRQLVSLLRSSKASVILGWMYHANVAATLARRLACPGTPLLWSIHHALDRLEQERLSTRLAMALCRRLSRSADAIVYVSQPVRQQHEARGYSAQNGVVITHGVKIPDEINDISATQGVQATAQKSDQEATQRVTVETVLKTTTGSNHGRQQGPQPNAGHAPEARHCIGTLARFHPSKDYPTLISALAIVTKRLPNTTALLAGTGVTWSNPELCTLLARVDLSPEQVRCVGFIDDKVTYFADIDVYAVASKTEAGPITLLEAMAHGVPCVSTDVGDARHMLGPEYPVVAVANAAALAQALIDQLCHDRREESGRALARRAAERFSQAVMLQAWRQCIERLSGTASGAEQSMSTRHSTSCRS